MRGLFYIICLIITTGCSFSGTQMRTLDEAQRLMQKDPSAALSRLNDVDVSEFKDSATMARWALLYSEAMVINELSAPTDTIVNIAVDYYGRHNLTAEFQKASRIKALISHTSNTDALATALYLQKEKEFFLYKERIKREQILFAGLFILLFATGIIMWMYERMKLKSIQNESLMAEACSLKKQIDLTHGNIGRLETTLHGMLENRFILIDSLCQTYYESQGTKIERKAIIDKVKNEIESLRNGSLSEMEQAVNDCRDNLLLKVRETYPQIKEDDYQLLVYLSAGLSTRTICLLLGQSVDVVYKRKSRLKSRMRDLAAPFYPDIMDIF